MAKERPKLDSFWFKLNHWITRRIHIINVPVSDKAVIRIAWTGHRLVLCGLCLQCTILAIPGPTLGSLVKRNYLNFLNSNTKNQGTQQRKQCIACIHWPHDKIDVGIRDADSHASRLEVPVESLVVVSNVFRPETSFRQNNQFQHQPRLILPGSYDTKFISDIYVKNHDVNVSDSSTRTA
jgi:hypothetical protein